MIFFIKKIQTFYSTTNSFSKHLDTMANMTDFRYCKTDFWSIELNQILVWQRDFTANLFRWEILIFVLYKYLDIFNYLGSKKGTIFYYNPRKVHSKALILLWNDHQFSIFWFLTKVVVSVKLCEKVRVK